MESLPSEVWIQIFELLDEDSALNASLTNKKFYDLICEARKSKCCLKITSENITNTDFLKAILESKKMFTKVQVHFPSSDMNVSSERIPMLFVKFGEMIESAEFYGHYQSEIPLVEVISLIEYIPNVKELKFSSIRIQKNSVVYSSSFKKLEKLETLKISQGCDKKFLDMLQDIPTDLLKKLELCDGLDDFANLIKNQSKIEDLTLKTDTIQKGMFDHLKLKKFKRYSSKNIASFLQHQQKLQVLSLSSEGLQNNSLKEIAKMRDLRQLELDIENVSIESFASLFTNLENLESLQLTKFYISHARIEFLNVLANQRWPKLRKLDLAILSPEFEINDEALQAIEHIGLNSPKLCYFKMKACWSYELLYTVFKNFTKLEVLIATIYDYPNCSCEGLPMMEGNVESLFETNFKNKNLKKLHIDTVLKCNSRLIKMLYENFPNLYDFDLELKNRQDRYC